MAKRAQQKAREKSTTACVRRRERMAKSPFLSGRSIWDCVPRPLPELRGERFAPTSLRDHRPVTCRCQRRGRKGSGMGKDTVKSDYLLEDTLARSEQEPDERAYARDAGRQIKHQLPTPGELDDEPGDRRGEDARNSACRVSDSH